MVQKYSFSDLLLLITTAEQVVDDLQSQNQAIENQKIFVFYQIDQSAKVLDYFRYDLNLEIINQLKIFVLYSPRMKTQNWKVFQVGL